MTIPMVEDAIGKFVGDNTVLLGITPDEERRVIRNLLAEAESHLKEGNLYFIVSSRWFCEWENYIGLGLDDPMRQTDSGDLRANPLGVHDRPGPIDNSDIIDDGNGNSGEFLDLSIALLESRDYVLVPQTAWEQLIMWYNGGPAIPRKMISQGTLNKKQYNVEVYPLRLKLVDSRDNSETIIRLSRQATLSELYESVCILKGVDKSKALLWDYLNKHKHKELNLISPRKTLQESYLQMDQEILLEFKGEKPFDFQHRKDSTGNELALVAMEPLRSSITIAGGPVISGGHSSKYSVHGNAFDPTFTNGVNGLDSLVTSKRVEKGGLAGLQNMGNTCFMNSAIQCLVHTPPLVEYFLQDYSDEINIENPLGMHGELAMAFGELLRKLWSAGRNVVAPRVFKGKLSQFAPQFSGYNQHDSQELLAFLLDGLHEDLNRVKRKPYIEMKDWSGRPDEEVAQECWIYHKARNDSVIVDVCQGQYKSTLVCPVCGKISITFDPFMYLSLPLPSTITRSMTVTVFYGDGSGLPMPFTVSVLKHGNCGDLRQALSAACCLRTDEALLLAEVYDHVIHRFLEDSLEPLASLKDEDYIVAYRLPSKFSGKAKLEIVHKEKPLVESSKYLSGKFFGTPLITFLDTEVVAGANIEDAVYRLLCPLRRMSSALSNSAEENGIESEVAMEDSKDHDDLNAELLFRLFLTDDRLSVDKLISKDTVVKSGNRVRVILEWSQKEYKQYDHSYLKDLPVVYDKAGFSAKKTRQESVSLFSCLEAFLKEEPLGPNDMWYCPACKEHRQASKKLDLWMLPDILVFHLKRFSFSRFFKNKLDTFVDFPVRNLELSKYVKPTNDQSYAYDLYAVSCHYGGLGGGHYTAFAKLIDEDSWYNFDDSHVSPAMEAEIRTSAAYVLFYRRVKRGS